MARQSRRDEVSNLLSAGKSVAEISTLLGISKPQVYNYKRAIESSGGSKLAPKRSPGRPARAGATSKPASATPEEKLTSLDARISELREELTTLERERTHLVEEQRRYHAERLAALGGAAELEELDRLRATVAQLEAKLAQQPAEPVLSHDEEPEPEVEQEDVHTEPEVEELDEPVRRTRKGAVIRGRRKKGRVVADED